MNSRGSHWHSLGTLLPLISILILTACSRPDSDDDAKSDTTNTADESTDSDSDSDDQEEERVPVEVLALSRGSIEAVLRFSTNLEAEKEVEVFSEASRQVVSLLVEEGDRVNKGQTLLRLQDEEQRSRLAQAKSQHDKAQREYKRQQNLFEKELISEQAFNDSTFEVEQRGLELDDAKRELTYTEVRAPISGTITNRLVNLGDHLTMNQHLFDLVDFNSIVARVFIPEREIGRLRVGQVARIESDSLAGGARSGKVSRISPIVDSRTGTVKTTVAIPSNQNLRPGMYVEVELVVEVHTDALLVPKRAIVYDNDQSFLFRLVEGADENPTAERLQLKPLLADRDFIEAPDGTLNVGDLVIVAGQAGLKDGAEIKLLTPTTATPSATETPGIEEEASAEEAA